MGRKQSKFMIGIFVTIGVIVAVVAIVWLGASNYFQKGTLFATYFDESVQGLAVDSTVKYRGVNVGTVRTINVAPDNKLIEVIMKIFMEGGDEKNLSAKLKSAGLTGIVYVELDRQNEEGVKLSPEITFPTEYPVILSHPSDSKYLLSLVDNIISEMNKIDIKGIFGELRAISGGIERYVNGPKVKNIVNNLESTSARLDHAMQGIDKLIADGNIDGVVKEARGTIADTRALIAKLRNDLEQMKLTESAGKAGQIVADMDKTIKDMTYDLKNTTDNLQKASENLDIMMDRLRDDPSELLFSSPPPVSSRER